MARAVFYERIDHMVSPVEFVEVHDVVCRSATEKAIRIEAGDGESVWIPRSQISPDSDVTNVGHIGTLIVQKWLAVKNGLI